MSNMLDIKLPEAGASLTKDQLEKVADNFRLLDRDKDGRLTSQEVGILFRAFGQNPTDEELSEMLRGVPTAGLDVDEFIQFFSTNYRTPTTEDTLVRAFQVFDLNNTGFIAAEKFKDMLTSLGEPMPQEEVDGILREAEVNDKACSVTKRLRTDFAKVRKGYPTSEAWPMVAPRSANRTGKKRLFSA
eukprot:CAMPEP_0117581406 /NCGR_PEP_ID=MMETSP0784-20121206/65806_1 /TAXON_ID=39447 /ORGANISM="" /LENGTH=186 /DNA_ID=CAMNT_0005381707 /DNA_START=54 /DNA_END=611 /DNA_ORIENTATION=+